MEQQAYQVSSHLAIFSFNVGTHDWYSAVVTIQRVVDVLIALLSTRYIDGTQAVRYWDNNIEIWYAYWMGQATRKGKHSNNQYIQSTFQSSVLRRALEPKIQRVTNNNRHTGQRFIARCDLEPTTPKSHGSLDCSACVCHSHQERHQQQKQLSTWF